MHVHETVQLAGLVALHGPDLIESPAPLSPSGIEQYWVASKCRLDRWARALKAHIDLATSSLATPAERGNLLSIIEEIFVGEALTRVWAAIGFASDRARRATEVEPVVRSVLIGHLEARHRALKLLVHGPGLQSDAAVKINGERRRVERWTDLLVGRLTAFRDVSHFAFDPARAQEFAVELGRQRGPADAMRWTLAIASLRAAFPLNHGFLSPNAELNQTIAGSVLACFPAEMFDGAGLTRAAWHARLFAKADDAQGLIDSLFDEPASEPPSSGLVSRFAHRGL